MPITFVLYMKACNSAGSCHAGKCGTTRHCSSHKTMETQKFKTNIKCGSCIASVTPFLNEAVGEGNWQVDVQNPNKVLTVENVNATLVKRAIEKAGYKAEPLTT